MHGEALLTNKWPSNGASIVRPPTPPSSLSVLGVVYKKNCRCEVFAPFPEKNGLADPCMNSRPQLCL